MLGHKRVKKSNSLKQNLNSRIELENNEIKILDVDKLHDEIGLSQDIDTYIKNMPKIKLNQTNEETTKQNELNLTDKLIENNNNIERNIRKSQRTKRHYEDNTLDVINCHQCRVLDTANNTLTCSNFQCRESFCFSCIKKYRVLINYFIY